MAEAAIGLGSNMGDRRANLELARERLAASPQVDVLQRSSLYETPPWGDLDQPAFLNACLRIETSLGPNDLLALCLSIEQQMGRVRTRRWGPRLIDIDLLWLGDLQIASDTLTLPHPQIQNRAFVLAPLCDIAPDKLIDDGERTLPVREWLAQTDQADIVRLAC